jgi:hypothetical protein
MDDNTVSKFNSYITDLLPIINEYVNRLEAIYDKKQYDIFTREFNKIEKSSKLLADVSDLGLSEEKTKKKEIKVEKTILAIFALYTNYVMFYNDLADFIRKLSKHYDDVSRSDKSNTFKVELDEMLSRIVLIHDGLNKQRVTTDVSLTTSLSNLIFNIAKSDNSYVETVEYIRKLYQSSPFSIGLYANTLQLIVDKLSNSPDLSIILNLIELDKDEILDGHVTSIFKTKNIHLINPPLKRFGLIPTTDSLKLDELLRVIANKSISGKSNIDVCAKALSKNKDIGVIVMKHIVYTPIEYNLRTLILKPVAEKLIQPDTFGPNEKMIKRFTTMRAASNKKWDFSYNIYNEKAKSFYILETLDGEYYRCLGFNLQNKVYTVDAILVSMLIDYINNKNKPGRIANYQSMMIKEASKHMFLRKPLELESYEGKSSEVPSHVIKQDVYYVLDLIAKNITKTSYSNNIKSPVEINDLLHDVKFGEAFYNKVLELYPKMVIADDLAKFDVGAFPYSELLSSFLVNLTNNTNRFMKELHDGYVRDPLKDAVFAMKDSERMPIIRKKIEDIIANAIDLIIKDSDNLYSDLHYKYLLLNFH